MAGPEWRRGCRGVTAPPGDRDVKGDIAVIIPPTPVGKRGGVMLAQEGDGWTVTLAAHFGNYPPEDLSRFIEFARTIPAPYIYEVIRDAEDSSGSTAAVPSRAIFGLT
jgi:hypothetical protein